MLLILVPKHHVARLQRQCEQKAKVHLVLGTRLNTSGKEDRYQILTRTGRLNCFGRLGWWEGIGSMGFGEYNQNPTWFNWNQAKVTTYAPITLVLSFPMSISHPQLIPFYYSILYFRPVLICKSNWRNCNMEGHLAAVRNLLARVPLNPRLPTRLRNPKRSPRYQIKVLIQLVQLRKREGSHQQAPILCLKLKRQRMHGSVAFARGSQAAALGCRKSSTISGNSEVGLKGMSLLKLWRHATMTRTDSFNPQFDIEKLSMSYSYISKLTFVLKIHPRRHLKSKFNDLSPSRTSLARRKSVNGIRRKAWKPSWTGPSPFDTKVFFQFLFHHLAQERYILACNLLKYFEKKIIMQFDPSTNISP